MSTQNMIPEIERKDVGQRVPPSPPSQYPQLPPPQPNGNRWTWIAIVTVALVLLLSVGTLFYVQAGRPGGQSTPTSSGKVLPTQPAASTPTQPAVTPQPTQPSATQVPGNGTTPVPTANVKWGPQTCPAGARDPARWASLIGIKGSSMKIEGISCANVIGDPSLQAMVTVRHTDTLRTLDVYAFDRITSTHPARLLKLTGLTLGDAKISYYNTLMTAEANLSSPINKGKPEGGLTKDLFREFAWRSDQQGLTQVAFPGFFPDLTRYQAEADQALVNKHVDTWKNNAATISKELAKKFFKWDRTITATVVSGGGTKDVSATVKVVEAAIGGASNAPTVNVRLSRLEGNIQNMWVAIGVEDTNMLTVTNIGARSLVSSPVLVTGKGAAFEAVIGNAFVLDHLYNDIGHARVQASGSSGMGMVPYASRVTYATTFTKGVQEGIIEVQASNGGISSDVQSAVMVKVLLNPALAPAPDGKNPRYWDAIVGAKAGVSRVASVTLANMKGDSSQQAIVTVYYEASKSIKDIYVFDKITNAQPVRLFSWNGLTNADVAVSGYHTLLIAEVDRNSSLNKGKSPAQWKQDLFREFAWNSEQGVFVQVAFPGLFPDLTRYQAEQDQRNLGPGAAWKYDAAQVAKHMAVQMLAWPNDTQAKVLSGGSAKDVDAAVLLTSSSRGKPTVKVTLSRLEGNIHNMWVVINAQTTGMTITSPQGRALLSSPVMVTGSGSANEGQIGMLYVLDHLYNKIGSVEARGEKGWGPTTFAAHLNYSSSPQSTQEGVLVLYSSSAADGKINGVVMLKELVG